MVLTTNDVAADLLTKSERNLPSRLGFSKAYPYSYGCGIAFLVFVATFFYLLPFFRFTTLNADEGIVLQGAQRILDGQVLYRDFFSFYTPGSYYWTALLLRLFGDTILVPRFALLIYGATLSSITFLLARRVCGLWTSLLAAYLTTLITLPFSFYVQHNWESTVLAATAVLCLVRLVEASSPSRWFLAGFLISLTILFEQSKGGGLFLGSGLGVSLLATRGGLRVTSQSMRAALFGLGAPFVVAFLYFAAHHALFLMFTDWFWPLRHYSIVNHVPYGFFPLSPGQADRIHTTPLIWRTFIWFSMSPLFLIPVLPFLAAGYVFFQARCLRTAADSVCAHYVLVGSTLVGLWLGVLVSRRDAGHVIYLLPLFVLPLAWIIEGRRLRSWLLPKIRPLIVLWVLFSFTFLGLSMLFEPLNGHDQLETRRGSLKANGIDTVFAYVQTHVRPGNKIFVYPYQPLYYYLTGASNPTAYEYFQPGMHSSEQVADAIQQLDRDKTEVVMFTTSFSEIIYIPWPNTPDKIIAQQDPMALYIVRHYRPCKSLTSTTNGNWVWLYMVRVETPCPENSARHFSEMGGIR
jgi:hypothetical protein